MGGTRIGPGAVEMDHPVLGRCNCRGVYRTPHHPYYLPKAQISKHLSVLSLVRVRGSPYYLLPQVVWVVGSAGVRETPLQ